MRHENLSEDELRAFVIQRYYRSLKFMELLHQISKNAEDQREDSIHQAVKNNIDEELGIVDNSRPSENLHHETWRKWWYQGIGITEESLRKTRILNGTQEYLDHLSDVIKRNHLLEMISVLAFLEDSIPYEFNIIRKQCERIFPTQMKDAQTSHYLKDHIEHDFRHFREIVEGMVTSKVANVENWPLVEGQISKFCTDLTQVIDQFLQARISLTAFHCFEGFSSWIISYTLS